MFHVQESILKLLFDSVISTINAKVAENGELCRDFQSKSWIHTHTKKKDEGDLSSSKSLLQGAEKDMDEIKTAMGLQENTKKWSTSRTKADGTIAQCLEYKNRRAGCAKWLNRKSEIKDMVSFKV